MDSKEELKLKTKAVEQVLDYAKTCIHKQLSVKEFEDLFRSIFNFYTETKSN